MRRFSVRMTAECHAGRGDDFPERQSRSSRRCLDEFWNIRRRNNQGHRTRHDLSRPVVSERWFDAIPAPDFRRGSQASFFDDPEVAECDGVAVILQEY